MMAAVKLGGALVEVAEMATDLPQLDALLRHPRTRAVPQRTRGHVLEPAAAAPISVEDQIGRVSAALRFAAVSPVGPAPTTRTWTSSLLKRSAVPISQACPRDLRAYS